MTTSNEKKRQQNNCTLWHIKGINTLVFNAGRASDESFTFASFPEPLRFWLCIWLIFLHVSSKPFIKFILTLHCSKFENAFWKQSIRTVCIMHTCNIADPKWYNVNIGFNNSQYYNNYMYRLEFMRICSIQSSKMYWTRLLSEFKVLKYKPVI